MKVKEFLDLLPAYAEVEITDAEDRLLVCGRAESISEEWRGYDVGAIVPGVMHKTPWKGAPVVFPMTTIRI